jgi:preprotein translocase subunit SecD
VVTLSQQLKFGSLPLSFTIQDFSDVTATLGLQQMQMGLLAGLIGLALVVLYCLFYYRALGLVVILSLLASGALVFASLVLLGRYQGYTLSLAGIAGFIVAIGITADSFVVFFERLKDEVKDGRTVRSAVPRAWVRARRTILSADTVSFLAAAVLYFLALGPVKGFAFTLGLSTLIDVLVVFLFTHPLVAVLARSSGFTSPRFSGLGNLRSDRAIPANQATNRLGAVRTKES